MRDETRPPPDWLGDVSEGVDAWTRRADGPGPAPSELSEPTEPSGARSGRPSRGARQGRSGQGRPGQGRSRRGARERRPDGPLPADPVADGPEADPESVARTILLDQLTGRARSRKELADKLASKDVPGEIAVRLLDRFEEVGLVDDEAFARLWVTQRQSAAGGGKGLARRALQQELRRKGVDDDTSREVLDDVDPAAEEESARLLVRRKLRSVARVDDAVATRRLAGMLARKGYGAGLAFSVVRDELASAGRDAPDDDEAR